MRNISSPDPYLYIIEDEAKLSNGDGACFILNTYGDIRQDGENYTITDSGKKLTIHTRNLKPDRGEAGQWGVEGKARPVNRLCLYCSGRDAYQLTTAIRLGEA